MGHLTAAAPAETEAGLAESVSTTRQYHWQDDFSPAEQAKLQRWVDDYVAAMDGLVGPLPFTLHIYMHRYAGAREPVPWAQTQRTDRQGVIFYVNPAFSARALRDDWTAPHELSHLILPYLGRRHAWFAEGFASYMQYQVMMAGGVLTASQARQMYLQRFERAQGRYDMDDMPFAEAAPKLRDKRQYPTMYWGGAIYFWEIAEELQRRQQNLPDVLREFMRCCRTNSGNLDDLVQQLDQVSRTRLFSEQLQAFQQGEGFPEFGR
ncbi:MAG: hypothetical protein AAF993_20055 [Pseudomonadota bacterium]